MNSSAIIYGLIMLGACLLLRDKVPYIGRLPGDFYFTVGKIQIFAPIMSMFIISFILSILRNLLN